MKNKHLIPRKTIQLIVAFLLLSFSSGRLGQDDIQGVSEIGGQTLRAYSTCCRNENSHINMGPEMLPLQVINIFY